SDKDLGRWLPAIAAADGLLAELARANLLARRWDRVAFGHELFLNAFAAESVIRKAEAAAAPITATLNNPKHAQQWPLILGAIDDHRLLVEVLAGIAEPKILEACFSGECGQAARDWVRARAPDLWAKMRKEAQMVRFMISPEGWSNVGFESDNLEQWTG